MGFNQKVSQTSPLTQSFLSKSIHFIEYFLTNRLSGITMVSHSEIGFLFFRNGFLLIKTCFITL